MPERTPSTPDLVEVAFKHRRRRIFRNDRQFDLLAGDDIIVGVRGGIDFGHITMTGELVLLRAKPHASYNRVIRLASIRDRQRHEANRKAEQDALHSFRAAAKRRSLALKAVDAEWQHDRKRIVFFYTAQDRVRLRSLISELGRKFKARVELKRINDRQEAARIGGIGVCGRELCCSSWMHAVPTVSLSAAKKQHFPLSPDRLRGRCNRLKCCLNYELDQYMDALKDFPRLGAHVKTDSGTGRVDQVDIFGRKVLVRYKEGPAELIALDAITSAKVRKSRAPRRR